MSEILVVGDWHLASTTAAGLLELGYTVRWSPGQTDDPPAALGEMAAGRRAAGEPRVAEIFGAALSDGRLSVTADEGTAPALSIVAYDTETDTEGASVDARPARTAGLLLRSRGRRGPVVVMSQLRAGTCNAILRSAPVGPAELVHMPENLRLGRAVADFLAPHRLILGCDADPAPAAVLELVHRLAPRELHKMTMLEAELVKHATNTYLAALITLANDVGTVAAHLGADPRTVLDGVRADPRVADTAPLRPGQAYSGATLQRDVQALAEQGAPIGRDGLFRAISRSNAVHALAPVAVLDQLLDGIRGRRIGLLGLTYKPDVSTLRDSPGVRLAHELVAQGAEVAAFDPVAEPGVLPGIRRVPTLAEAAEGARCLVLTVEHSAFGRPGTWDDLGPAPRILLRLGKDEAASTVATPAGWESVNAWSR